MVPVPKGLLLAAFLAAASPAFAQTHGPEEKDRTILSVPRSDSSLALDLNEVLARVRLANPEVEASRWMAAAASAQSDQVGQLPDPMISTMFMGGGGRMARSEWMAEQSFPWPGTLTGRRNVTIATAERARHSTERLVSDLEFQAARTYFEAAAIDEKVEQLRHFVEELRGFEAAATAKYEVGAGPQQAILRMQLERNAIVERGGSLLMRRAELIEDLRRLAGGAPEAGWLERPLVFPNDPPRPATRHADNVSTVDERVLESGIAAADARVELARLAFRPAFSARISFVEGSIMRGGRDAIGIGGAVMIPLWRGGRRAGLEEARAERSRLDAEMQALRLDLDTERATVKARLEQGLDLFLLIEGTLIPQAEATRDATASAYTNGRADYLDLLDAERMLLDLRLSRVDRVLGLHQDVALATRLNTPTTEPINE